VASRQCACARHPIRRSLGETVSWPPSSMAWITEPEQRKNGLEEGVVTRWNIPGHRGAASHAKTM